MEDLNREKWPEVKCIYLGARCPQGNSALRHYYVFVAKRFDGAIFWNAISVDEDRNGEIIPEHWWTKIQIVFAAFNYKWSHTYAPQSSYCSMADVTTLDFYGQAIS